MNIEHIKMNGGDNDNKEHLGDNDNKEHLGLDEISSQLGDILNMINELESGNEPVILKICSGTATPDEINMWREEQNLNEVDLDEIINSMKGSFIEGARFAETIDNTDNIDNIDCINNIKNTEPDNTDILQRLNMISDCLDNVKNTEPNREDILQRLDRISIQIDELTKEMSYIKHLLK